MPSQTNVGERCIECDASVRQGSGNYVNRIPASNDAKSGFLCTECQMEDCDRCGYPDYEINTVEHDACVEHVCDLCLTQKEKETLDDS